MTTRLFLLKLCATLSVMICSGCQPLVSVNPQPAPQPNAKPMELKITIDGEGKINVGGDASITAKSARESEPQTRCNCGCGQDGCSCPRGQTSAASTVGTSAGSGPQFVTQYRLQQVCKPNGQCEWVRVPVQVPLSTNGGGTSVAAMPKRLSAPATQGGRVRVLYEFDTGTIRQMRQDLPGTDFEHVHGDAIPVIDGYRWTPTIVKPDGSAWTPGASGWNAGAIAAFNAWRASP